MLRRIFFARLASIASSYSSIVLSKSVEQKTQEKIIVYASYNNIYFQATDQNHIALSGTLLYIYKNKSTILDSIFQDHTELIPINNPISLNSLGKATFWLSPKKKYTLKLRNLRGDTIWSHDGIMGEVQNYFDTYLNKKIMDSYASDNGSSLIGFNQTGTKATSNTVLNKLRERVSIQDYCSPEQRESLAKGDIAVDISSAWQKALNAVSPGGTVCCGGGNQLLANQISIRGKSGITIDIEGAYIHTPNAATEVLLKFTNCHKLRIRDGNFIGSETQEYFLSNSPKIRRQFIAVHYSDKVTIQSISGEKKRGFILLNKCNRSNIFDVDFDGFMQDIDKGHVPHANECPAIEISGGKYNKVWSIHAQNHGSAVLIGLDSIAPTVFSVTAYNLHDNIVYASSSRRARIFGCDGEKIYGQFVKSRGSLNIIFGCSGENSIGSGFSITGNGSDIDNYGSNGHGNIISLCSAENMGGHGISISNQDGYYPRDNIAALNAIEKLTNPGKYAGINGFQTHGGTYLGNIISKVGTNYSMLINSPSSQDSVKSVVIIGNSSIDEKNNSSAIFLSNLNQPIIAMNTGDIKGVFIQPHFVDNGIFIGNASHKSRAVIKFTDNYPCNYNIISNNRGYIRNTEDQTNGIMQNFPGTTERITNPPSFIGQISVVSENAYIAIGTNSITDWKQINN